MSNAEGPSAFTHTTPSWLFVFALACAPASQNPGDASTTTGADPGELDAQSMNESETAATPKRCGPGQGETLTLTSNAQLEAIVGCGHFTGNIESFGGHEPLDEVQLSAAFSALEAIEGDVRLKHLKAINRLSLPELRSVAGQLTVSGLDQLRQFAAPKLEQVRGEVSLAFCPGLEELSLPALEHSGGLSLTSLSALVSLHLPELVTIDARLTLSRVHVLDAVQLTRLGDLEQLHLETTRIPNLRSALPALRRVDDWLIIRANHAFDDDHARQFVAGLDHIGGEVTIYGNPAENTEPAPHRHPRREAALDIETASLQRLPTAQRSISPEKCEAGRPRGPTADLRRR